MYRVKSIVWLFFCFCFLDGIAQQSVLNNTSSGQRWNQVVTPSFRIIFPDGHDAHAQHVARTLEAIHKREYRTLSLTPPKQISIILQDFNSFSNGFIAFGPRRGEFFTMPPQDPDLAGTNNWLDLLAVHEYRHVVQYHHSRQGFTRLMYYLFGQQTQSGTAFGAVPRWFWEGDATLSETLYTPGGRGRIPAFGRVFRANLLEGKRYSYNKQHLSSYRDYVPDHYKLGYYFVTHLYRRTGDPMIWSKVTADAFKWAFVPFTFSNSLKRHTGEYLLPNYSLMMDELDSIWRSDLADRKFTEVADINRRQETTFTDYKYPVLTPDGTIVAMRTGLGDVREFVTFDNSGTPKILHTPGIINESGMLSLQQNTLVWNEFNYDPRWRQKTYSVIKKMDVRTGKVTRLTDHSRYAGAALSPDGSKIVTTFSTTDYKSYLVVLDALSGNVINRLPNPDDGLYAMAQWAGDGRGIVALKTINSLKGIIYFNYQTGMESWLLPPSRENAGHPVLRDSVLFFNSPYDGIDNIHAIDLRGGQRYQVTESRYGAYNPVITEDGNFIIYNDHRVNGLDVVRIPYDSSAWKPVTIKEEEEFYFTPVMDLENGSDLLDSLPDTSYPVVPYRRFPRMFNVHSWGLLASTDINTIQAAISSQDVMSTFGAGVGYVYDRTENSGYGYAQVSYQGIYPIIDATVEYGTRQSDRGVVDSEELIYDWKETSLIGGIRLPLILTRSKWVSEFSLQERVGITKVTDYTSTREGYTPTPTGTFEERLVKLASDTLYLFLDDEISNGDIVYNNINLFYYALWKQSPRDIYSKFGTVISLRHYATPFGGDFQGALYSASGTFYVPSPLQLTGLPAFKHHGIALRAAYQYQPDDFSEDYYRFRNQIPLPRGYSYSNDFADVYYFGADYTFPAWYPDISLGPLAYFKRIRVTGFYDYALGNNTIYVFNGLRREVRGVFREYEYKSAGAELMVDMHVMRFAQEFGIGVRYSRLLSTQGNSFDLLLNIEF